jgi:hypothetical protein
MGLPSEIQPALVTERSKKLFDGSAVQGVDEQIHIGELSQRDIAIDVTGKDRAFERQQRETCIRAESHDTDEFGRELPVASTRRVSSAG